MSQPASLPAPRPDSAVGVRSMNRRGAWAATASLPARPEVVRHARRLTRTALAAWGAGHLVDGAEMIVSELVTNAVRYGHGPVDLAIALTDEMLRISVSDGGPCLPVPREAGPGDQSGRGLLIVEALAESWEVRAGLDGKTVSCVLPTGHAGPAGAGATASARAGASSTAAASAGVLGAVGAGGGRGEAPAQRGARAQQGARFTGGAPRAASSA